MGTVVADIGFPEKDQLDSYVAEVNSDNREIETLEEMRRERERKKLEERERDVCVKLRYSFDAACFFFFYSISPPILPNFSLTKLQLTGMRLVSKVTNAQIHPVIACANMRTYSGFRA